MDLLLHIGQHKTGTTSIQQFISKNRDFFESQGICIPRTGQDPHFGHHHALMRDLRLRGNNLLLNDLTKELFHKHTSKLLISAEVIKNFIVENRYKDLLQNFRSLGINNIRVIMYLRNPFHLINASYCEQIKSLAVDGSDIDKYVERYVSRKYQGHYRFFDYDHLIDMTRQPDVTVILRPYNPMVASSVVTDFLATLGLPHEQCFLEPRRNVSPGPIAIEALRQIGGQIGPVEPSKKTRLIRHLNNNLSKFPEKAPYWGIDENMTRSAPLAKADYQTELLSQFAWGRSWREVIGNDHRPLNVFDPANAPSGQIKIYEAMLDRMRKTIAKEVF